MNILALDPATKCGWAVSPLISGVWDLSIRKDESAGMRLMRLKAKLTETHQKHKLDIVAYEAARATRFKGAAVVQASIQAVLIMFCEENNIEYVGYSPSEIKKFATGKGNASKEDMINAAIKFNEDIIDDNHADAIHILRMAKGLLD